MGIKLKERKPMSETVVGQLARASSRETPRNNLLLQLGATTKGVARSKEVERYNFDQIAEGVERYDS